MYIDTGFSKPPGTIKTTLTDFIVREIHGTSVLGLLTENDIRARPDPRSQRFTQFTLTKRGVPAQAAYRILARELGVQLWQITDCGMKDSAAVTSQRIVVEGGYVPRCRDDRLKLRYEGPAAAPLVRGGHTANYFSVLVRTDETTLPSATGWFQNYFGPQRFGDDKVDVGRHLLEGDFGQAIDGMLSSLDGGRLRNIAERKQCSLEAALFDPQFERDLHFRVLQWRSYLWNQLVKKVPDDVLPLWDAHSAWLYFATGLWDHDPTKVDCRLQEALFSSERQTMAQAKPHKVERVDSGFRHQFVLRPGSYATVFLATMYDITDASRQ